MAHVGSTEMMSIHIEYQDVIIFCFCDNILQRISRCSVFFFTAARLQAVTEWLGFSSKELPSSAQGSLQALAGVAGALEVKDCSDTSFCLALSDLCQRRARDTVKRAQLVREGGASQESIRRALVKQANQRR